MNRHLVCNSLISRTENSFVVIESSKDHYMLGVFFWVFNLNSTSKNLERIKVDLPVNFPFFGKQREVTVKWNLTYLWSISLGSFDFGNFHHDLIHSLTIVLTLMYIISKSICDPSPDINPHLSCYTLSLKYADFIIPIVLSSTFLVFVFI